MKTGRKLLVRQMFDQVPASWVSHPVQLVNDFRPVIGNTAVLQAVLAFPGIQKSITCAFILGDGEAHRAWIDDVHTPGSVLKRAMRVAYAHEFGIAVSQQRSHFRGVHG
jgi:hypothetical protein